MRKIVICALFIVLLFVSCDGTVMRDIVDSKKTTGYTIIDYIDSNTVLTDKGVISSGGTELLKNSQISNVSKCGSDWYVLFTNGALKKGSISNLSDYQTGVKNLTQSGFWTKNNKVGYRNISTPTNGSVVYSFESDGYLLVKEGEIAKVYDSNLNVIYSRSFANDTYGAIYGYIHTTNTDTANTSKTDYIIGYSTIYKTTGTDSVTTYKNAGPKNVGFAYYYNGNMRICYQNSTSFACYDPVSKKSYNCLEEFEGFSIVEYCNADKVLATKSNGLYSISISPDGIPVATKLSKEF